MALGQVGKPNGHLLETLLQLNDLVKSLSGHELPAHIDELKKHTESFNSAKASAEPMIHALKDAMAQNEQSTATNNASLKALAEAKLEHERHLIKIQKAQNAVDAAKSEHDKKIAISTAEIEQKAHTVSVREARANEKQKGAESLIAEYDKKLADLKKITG